MDYCPEIAVLHGAFALIENESKSGKFDLLQHTKGVRSSRPFLILKEVIQEIIHGPDTPHCHRTQQHWSRCLHHIFFCKSFVFNTHFVQREVDEEKLSKTMGSFKAQCHPIPDFHPHLYFDLSDEFGWAEFLGEFLVTADLPTALDFTAVCLEFCSSEPALLYDLNLISLTLDFLVSACFTEMLHPSGVELELLSTSDAQEGKNKQSERDAGGSFFGGCSVSKLEYKELHEKCLQAALAGRQQRIDDAVSGNSELTAEQPNQPDEESRKEFVKDGGEPDKQLQKESVTFAGEADEKTHKGVTQVDEKQINKVFVGVAEDLNEKSGKEVVEMHEKKTHKEFDTVTDQLDEKTNKENDEKDEKKTHRKCDTITDQLDEETYKEVIKVADQLMQEKIVEKLDQQLHDSMIKLTDHVTAMLVLVQKRMSTKLFDRSSCKREAMASVLNVLGHILASVIVFSVMSVSSAGDTQLKELLSSMIAADEDDEDEPDLRAGENDGTSTKLGWTYVSPVSEHVDSVNLVTVVLGELMRTAQVRTTCTNCLSSFFASQTAKERPAQKLSAEKSRKFGRVLKLSLNLCKVKKPLRTTKVMEELSGLLAGWSHREKNDTAAELQVCLSAMLKELERREKLAEEKRRNPTLEEVMQKVQKRLPRWMWCLQFGLAKRDLKGWWFAGFLEFLHKTPKVLDKESDVRHLLSVLAEIVRCAVPRDRNANQKMCAELILRTFSHLPVTSQETLILDVYKETELPALPLVPNLEQSLTVTFNKLSASTSSKDLHAALQLALHDPLTFTEHAVSMAISNRGQIPVVVKVLRLMPAVMRSVHRLRHPDHSLLCHSLHTALVNRALDATEQKNVLSLVSSLVQTFKTDAQHPPLLSPTEFLSTSALPFIALHASAPPITVDFALRLLIGCLDATLAVKFSDWLEEVHPAVIVACCAEILQECGELGKEVAEVDRSVKIKSLALTILDRVLEHSAAAGKTFEGHSLGWLQEKCTMHDWTVCAYLARFLVPSSEEENNPIVKAFAAEAAQQVSVNPAALLKLSATSDAAAVQVTQALQLCRDVLIPEAAVLQALCQLLPQLLVSEVKRVVSVMSTLVSSQLVNTTLRHLFVEPITVTDLPEWYTEVVVSQLLTDAVVLIILHQSCASASVLHHVAQVLVAAVQALLPTATSRRHTGDCSLLFLHVFSHICIIMSAAPDVMQDSLFVVLLDMLARLTQPEPSSSSQGLSLISRSLEQGIFLIPRESLRDTLSKKLESQILCA